MTPAELRAILDRLGLPQVRAAYLLGVDERTIRRWIAGDRDVPETVARVMRMADGQAFPFALMADYGTGRER